MKKTFLIGLFSLFMSTLGFSQSSEIKAVKATITAFSKAGDESNATKLEKHLDDNYRVVMNRLFGSDKVGILSKSAYLQKIETKEFGGDTRKLVFEDIVINQSTASAKVTFKGTKMTFVSLILLIKDKDGMWKLISDVPVIG